MAGRYKFGTSTPPKVDTSSQDSQTDLAKLLKSRQQSSEPKKRKTSTLGITNPLMDDAATVLNTFYGGDPVLQGFLAMLSAARK